MNELEIIAHQRIKGFSVFFNRVDYRTPHIHPEWELLWILENTLLVTCGSDQLRVEPGQMILFNPSEPHEFHKEGNGCLFLCLQISPAILPTVVPVQVDGKLLHQYLSEAQLQAVKSQLADIIGAYLRMEEHFALHCVGMGCLVFHELLTALPTHKLTPDEIATISKRNALIGRLIQFVDENYMHKICLGDFAKAEGYSVSYLSRFIKRTLNQSFQDYVRSVRFSSACKRIASSNKRMLDVCMESGFSDYRYFSREFKRQYGMTPEQYSSQTQHPEASCARHSLHSAERFYSAEDSLKLIERYFP